MIRLGLHWILSFTTLIGVAFTMYEFSYRPSVIAAVEASIEESIKPVIEKNAKQEWFGSSENAENTALARRFHRSLQQALNDVLAQGDLPAVTAIGLVKIAETEFRNQDDSHLNYQYTSEIQIRQNQSLPVTFEYEPKQEPFTSKLLIFAIISTLIVLLERLRAQSMAPAKGIPNSGQHTNGVAREPRRELLVSVITEQGFDSKIAAQLADELSPDWITYLLSDPQWLNETIVALKSFSEHPMGSTVWYQYFVETEQLSPDKAIKLYPKLSIEQLPLYEELRLGGLTIEEALLCLERFEESDTRENFNRLVLHFHNNLGREVCEILDALEQDVFLSLIYSDKSVEIFGHRFSLKPKSFALYYLLIDQKINGYTQIRIPSREALKEFDDCFDHYYRRLPKSRGDKFSWDITSVKSAVHSINHELRLALAVSPENSIFESFFIELMETETHRFIKVGLPEHQCKVHTGSRSTGPGATNIVKDAMKVLGK